MTAAPTKRVPVGLVRIEPLYMGKEHAAAFLALSCSTFEAVGRMDSTFPKARKLSPGRAGYLVEELRAWGQARPVSDLLPPPNTGCRKPRRGNAIAPASLPASAVRDMVRQIVGHLAVIGDGIEQAQSDGRAAP